ncbi:hypothetical protein BBK36DRAFT_1179698 [Trichoderma citrinoviride]|uniref:Uncharacterized protein n=1 Tax=Trichoderma citrinoviride TaxID=58853 RepID=A0A2T4B588_9HYPO|nr:hypothetical protein BBK36DRAFT_1179698 [Trichoderma citrinoviride]PTB64495.1 hypothetical protein BBK36DRAFT_1179698 [Trichoderma citrinoviride]
MKSIVCTLQDDLQKAKTRVAALGRTVAENEVIITQANATAVSRLASNVSRDFTDDVIKETLRKFFQTDFFSWCADLCAEKIEDETAALRKLLEAGIINANRDHLDGPEYLIFKINTPDGSGPLMLLQAALATRLCDLYLADPYFLAQELPTNLQDRWMLPRLEHIFSHAALDAAINWRVQTVECLEQAVPITESYVTREVHRFVQEYGFLLSTDQFDHEAGKDLARIFANFAGLALKLWKSRAHVCCCGIRGFGEAAFDLGNPLIEVDSSLASSMGQRLNGRPIGLIIRPAIWANSLSQDGTVEQVVWLKALAWVSGEEGDMDLMELA